jgi:predicted DNA binding protein
MWEVTIGVRHTGCPISDTSANHPNVHLQNLAHAQHSELNGARRLLSLRGSSTGVEDFVSELDSHNRSQVIDNVGQSGSISYITVHIEYSEDNPSIRELVSLNQCYQRNVVAVRSGIEHWVVYVDYLEKAPKLVENTEEYDNIVNKYRTTQLSTEGGFAPLEQSIVLAELTSRQRTVYETALDSGYYSEDVNITLDEIADSLDIHQTTAWEHLKKAENKILTGLGTRSLGIRDDQ